MIVTKATLAPLLGDATRPGGTLLLRGIAAVAIADDAVGAADAARVRKMDLSANALTRLSGLHRLSALTWLSAAENALVGHALVDIAGLCELAFLNAGSCKIEAIPPGALAGQGRSLRALLLNDNKLRELRNIGHLQGLNTLVASNNKLRAVDRDVLRLTSLAKLSLSHNRIAELPDLSPLRALAELRLAHNSLEGLPRSLAALAPSLRVLDLGSNRIASWDALAPLAHLSRLVNLNLRGNPLAVGAEPTAFEARALALCPALVVLDGRRIARKEAVTKAGPGKRGGGPAVSGTPSAAPAGTAASSSSGGRSDSGVAASAGVAARASLPAAAAPPRAHKRARRDDAAASARTGSTGATAVGNADAATALEGAAHAAKRDKSLSKRSKALSMQSDAVPTQRNEAAPPAPPPDETTAAAVTRKKMKQAVRHDGGNAYDAAGASAAVPPPGAPRLSAASTQHPRRVRGDDDGAADGDELSLPVVPGVVTFARPMAPTRVGGGDDVAALLRAAPVDSAGGWDDE